MPPNQTKTIGNDDQGIWGLVAMSAAEMGFKTPGGVTGSWADMAINVFNDLAARWDTQTCGGGLRWQIFPFNKGYSYKNSISTGIFFLLSSRLAVQFPKNTTYSVWAEKAFDWAQGSGLVKDFHVYDGSDVGGNCSSINHIQWTMNHATFTEGAAVMYNLVGSRFACGRKPDADRGRPMEQTSGNPLYQALSTPPASSVSKKRTGSTK